MNHPASAADPLNHRILCVAEDAVTGFHRHPFRCIADRTGIDEAEVISRLKGMLQAGTIRRVRQTLLSTSLAEGALIAWRVPEARLESAYAWLSAHDPVTGHVVIRECSNSTAPYKCARLSSTS